MLNILGSLSLNKLYEMTSKYTNIFHFFSSFKAIISFGHCVYLSKYNAWNVSVFENIFFVCYTMPPLWQLDYSFEFLKCFLSL